MISVELERQPFSGKSGVGWTQHGSTGTGREMGGLIIAAESRSAGVAIRSGWIE